MENQQQNDQIEQQTATPIAANERFYSMDMLRGVAILGILVMNIYAFAMPFPAYNNPLIMGGTDSLNLGTWFFTHVIFDQKFLAIFSMLYGAGMIMMLDRAVARGAKAGGLFYRRSFWLLLFGMLHGYFIWFGDILFGYAVSGMIVFLFRNRKPKTLIISGVVFLLIGSLLTLMTSVYMGKAQSAAVQVEQMLAEEQEVPAQLLELKEQWDLNSAFMDPGEDEISKDVQIYKGSYADILEFRIPYVMMMQLSGTFFFILWRAGGLMLIGMGLMRLGIINGKRETPFYRKMMLYGYGIGLPMMFYSGYDMYQHEFDGLYYFGWGMMPNYWGSVLIALGHVGLVNYLYKTNGLQRLLTRFAHVGRMAFTNYLMQSIVLTTVFYGYGLNLYAEVPRFAQMGFVLALIIIQLLYSKWWLERYRFGPAEWLWRSLTYWKRQPFKH